MKEIKFDLRHVQGIKRNDIKVKVQLYDNPGILYDELENLGYIKHLKNTPQLGCIHVTKKFETNRYEYVLLQLHFHLLLKKNQTELKISYNNIVKFNDFSLIGNYHHGGDYCIMELIQILILIYNIGHFKNTFTSSKAFLYLLKANESFKKFVYEQSFDDRYQKMFNEIVKNNDYIHAHFINSWLMLERCRSNDIIELAKNLLYSYYFANEILEDQSKLKFTFELFKNVRSFTYYCYDLQIANQPFLIDLCNDSAILLYLKNLTTSYGDTYAYKEMQKSFNKLLTETLYNNKERVITYDIAVERLVRKYKKYDFLENDDLDYINDFVQNDDSIFNRKMSLKNNFKSNNLLKITLSDTDMFNILYDKIRRLESVEVGYYYRAQGKKTLVSGIRKDCSREVIHAFRLLKKTVNYIYNEVDNNIEKIKSNQRNFDNRYLIIVKFFLKSLFRDSNIRFDETITNANQLVYSARGKNQKVNLLQELLNQGNGTDSQRNEADTILQYLKHDNNNDLSIVLPCSILGIKDKSKSAEFDGMIIHPNRNILVFFESKKIKSKKDIARRDLERKFKKYNIPYDVNNFVYIGKNIYYESCC